MKFRREHVGTVVAIGLIIAVVAYAALLAAEVRSPGARAMKCMMKDNGWADIACERFAGLPEGWVWPR